MDIKSTAITAQMVIQSLVVLLENEDVDISTVKFKVGSNGNGYESPEFELERLIDLAIGGLGEIKESQAVPDWKDYTQQSPRIDGRYQIFINGEQLAADWKSPFGFADPIEGVALIQDLITHWAVLSADPVIVEQSHEH